MIRRSGLLACLGLSSIALAAWHLTFGWKLFSGLDGGFLLNIAWQELHHAVPYRDFLTGTPPLFVVPPGWAFGWWGPTWFSLLQLEAIFSVLTFLWSFLIIREGTKSPGQAMLSALLLQVIITMPTSWWWYNEMTWMACAIFLASTLSLVVQREPTIFSRASFMLSAAMTGLLKVNLAGLALPLVFLLLLFHRRLRGFVILAAAGAALLDLTFLGFNHISPLDLLHNYLAVAAGRMNLQEAHFFLFQDESMPLFQLGCLLSLAIAIFVLILANRRSNPLMPWAFYAVFAIACLLAVIGAMTDYERKAVSGSCLLVLLPYLRMPGFLSRAPGAWMADRACLTLIAAMVVSCLYMGVARTYFVYFGLYAYVAPEERIELTSPLPLAGLQVAPSFAASLEEVGQVLAQIKTGGPLGMKIFFGPNLESCYAAFGLPVQQGLPLNWQKISSTHRGDFYPFDDNTMLTRDLPSHWIAPGQPPDPLAQHFLDLKFDVCIFLQSKARVPSMTFMPGDLRADIYENYERHNYPHICVFIRKAGTVALTWNDYLAPAAAHSR